MSPRTVFIVDDHRDAVHVLRNHAYVQIRPESGHGAEYTAALAHGSVLHLDGGEHFERRRLLSTLFRRSLLLEYEQAALVPALDRAVRDRGAATSPSSLGSAAPLALDLLQLCREVFVDLFSRLVGFEGLDDREARSAFLADFAVYERGFRAKFVSDPERAVSDALLAKDRILRRNFASAWERRAREVEEAEAAGAAESDAVPADLMTLLLRNREHYLRWGDDAAWREAMLFMVASIGSTSNAICHAVADLLAWADEDDGAGTALDDPEFLSRAFRDSVRLHQTNQLLRTAVSDDVLPSGKAIYAGTVVAVDRATVNTEIEARSSDPRTRFAPSRVCPAGVRDHGLSFGDGPHSCIGRTMVLGDHGTRHDEGGEDRLEGLAVTTLRYLLAAGIAVHPEEPPTLVGGMARETWEQFPVLLGHLQGE